MRQDPDELNISRVLSFLRRRGLWVVLCLALAIAAAVAYSKEQTKKYTATSSLSFNNSSLGQALAGVPASSSSLATQQASELELLHLGNLAGKTAAALGHGLSAQDISSSISISGQPETTVAAVSATSASPHLAAEIANTYAQLFVKEQGGLNRQFYKSALSLVRSQLAALSPAQRASTDGVSLQERAQALQFLEGLQTNSVQVAQTAVAPTSPSSPRTKRNALIGALLGLFLGLGLALLLERLDPRVRGPGDLEAIYDTRLLGGVPQSDRLARPLGASLSERRTVASNETEAFHMIRALLRAFNDQREIQTVVVTSAAPGEGKTVVALHLAEAGARMGSRVLALEANLRGPSFTNFLDGRGGVGLGEVLSGDVQDAAIQTVALGATYEARGTLGVLPWIGSSPSNPVELLESDAMNVLLERARASYDLIVIDTPDLTSVSDAFLLMPKVDAVIVVGQIGRSRRDVAAEVSGILHASRAPLAGVIANRIKGSPRGSGRKRPSEHDDSTFVDSTATTDESATGDSPQTANI